MKKPIHLPYGFRNYIIAFVCSAAVAAGIGFFLYDSGLLLSGSAVYAQAYKLSVMSDAVAGGEYLPLYAEGWYNGYEIFRYSPPGAYLLITWLTRIFSGAFMESVCAFYSVAAFLALFGFCLSGARNEKVFSSFLAGIVYLFLPSTFYVAVSEGSFDMILGMSLLPLLFYFLHEFICRKRRLSLLPFSVIFCIFILSNYVLAAAFGIVVLFYLIVRALAQRTGRFELAAACNLLLVYAVMGYFLFPAVSGGLFGKSYSVQGKAQLFVGISLIVIVILGLITTDRKRFAGFFTTAVFVLLCLPVMEPVRRLIPSPVLQRMYWYLPVVVVIFLLTLLSWERLRTLMLFIMLGVMAAESIPKLVSGQETFAPVWKEKEEQIVADYLIDEALDCTDNRVALIDNTSLGAFPHFYFTYRGVDALYGWDFENARTVRNQMSLNEAFADGFYDYFFDRLLLYGSDVTVVLKELLPEAGSYDMLLAAAERNGYEIRAENEKAIVLKAAAVNGSYGVITQYENLAIGDSAYYIAYVYPSFEYGRSSCLEDYTIEELQKYNKLYLSGFTYRDKEKAENLLKELSVKGTEVYIDMQHIPVNELTGKNEFMGTYAQFVQFTEDFPVLENDNGNQFKLDFKVKGYDVWDTVYVSGCEDILKETAYDNKSHLVYLGQNHNPNVTFMGFNLLYYYLTTHNQDLKRFLDEAFGLSSDDLQTPVIVPVQVERRPSAITVHTEADRVNCNIADVETLQPDRIISTQENLFVVNQGDTRFRIEYPSGRIGMFLSIFGIAALGILWIVVYVLLENNDNKEPKHS